MTTDRLAEFGLHVRSGCDVVAVSEVADSLATFGDRYLNRVFTAAEIETCAGGNSVERLAARFAAKEAVIKALAEPEAFFPLKEIEVVNQDAVPKLNLKGSVSTMAAAQSWMEASISLSHTSCHAMATVFVLCRAQSQRSSKTPGEGG